MTMTLEPVDDLSAHGWLAKRPVPDGRELVLHDPTITAAGVEWERSAGRTRAIGPLGQRCGRGRRTNSGAREGEEVMRGSVFKRGKTWTIAYRVPDPDGLGMKKRKSKGGFRTKQEAMGALARVALDIEAFGDYSAHDWPITPDFGGRLAPHGLRTVGADMESMPPVAGPIRSICPTCGQAVAFPAKKEEE